MVQISLRISHWKVLHWYRVDEVLCEASPRSKRKEIDQNGNSSRHLTSHCCVDYE